MLFIHLAYCGWSGANILSSIFLGAYNSILTVTMTIYYGSWEQDINCDMYPPAKPYQPLFYKEYKRMGLFSYTRYIIWSITAIFAGTFVLFTTIYGYSSLNAADSQGRVPDRRGVGGVMALSAFLSVTLLIVYDSYNLTLWSWFNLIFLTLLVSLIFFIVENFTTMSTYASAYTDHNNVKFWLLVLANVGFLHYVRMAYNTLRFCFYPSLVQQWMVRRNRDYVVFSKLHRAELERIQSAPTGFGYSKSIFSQQPMGSFVVNSNSNALPLVPMGRQPRPNMTVPMPSATNLIRPLSSPPSPLLVREVLPVGRVGTRYLW